MVCAVDHPPPALRATSPTRGKEKARGSCLKATLGLIAAVGALLAAATASPALAQGKVMRIVPQVELRLLDPYVNPNYGSRNHGHLIYEQLFAFDG